MVLNVLSSRPSGSSCRNLSHSDSHLSAQRYTDKSVCWLVVGRKLGEPGVVGEPGPAGACDPTGAPTSCSSLSTW